MFVKVGNKTMWRPKPKSPAEVKANSTDTQAARLAKSTPTSGKQSILVKGRDKQFGPGKYFKASPNAGNGLG